MIPDKEFSTNLLREESQRLNSKLEFLASRDKDEIYEQGLELLSKQEFKEGTINAFKFFRLVRFTILKCNGN